MKKKSALIVLTTAPSSKSADKLADYLIENRLAACVNIIPKIKSFFCWEKKKGKTLESLLIIKTCYSRIKRLENELHKMHPYKVPEFLVLNTDYASKKYLKWVIESCAD